MPKSTKSAKSKKKTSKVTETNSETNVLESSQWTLERYSKLCREVHNDCLLDYADSIDDPMLWYDSAKSILEFHEDGLKQFMKTKLKVRDVIGCLADDLAYPGNCSAYRK